MPARAGVEGTEAAERPARVSRTVKMGRALWGGGGVSFWVCVCVCVCVGWTGRGMNLLERDLGHRDDGNADDQDDRNGARIARRSEDV